MLWEFCCSLLFRSNSSFSVPESLSFALRGFPDILFLPDPRPAPRRQPSALSLLIFSREIAVHHVSRLRISLPGADTLLSRRSRAP